MKTCGIHGTPLNAGGHCFPCNVAAGKIPEPWEGYKAHAQKETKEHDLCGWILEKGPTDNPVYLSVEQFMFSWEADPGKSLHLARRCDAEALCTIVEDAAHIREVRLMTGGGRACTWIWTAEDESGFWEAECKQNKDWPIGFLYEDAAFCSFCGNRLIVKE